MSKTRDAAFDAKMKGRRFGIEETEDARYWFNAGWAAALATPPAAPTMRRDPDIDRILSEPGVLEKLYDDTPAPAPAQGEPWPHRKDTSEPPEWESPQMDEWQSAIEWTTLQFADLLGVKDYDADAASETLEGDTKAILWNILIAAGAVDEETGKLYAAPPQPSPAVGQEPDELGWALAVAKEAEEYFGREDQRDLSRALVIVAREMTRLRSAHPAPAAVGQADDEIIKNARRYEWLRGKGPRRFERLWKEAVGGGCCFDHAVDEGMRIERELELRTAAIQGNKP